MRAPGFVLCGCCVLVLSLLTGALAATWMIEKVPDGRGRMAPSPMFGYFPYAGALTIALVVLGLLLIVRAGLVMVEELEELRSQELRSTSESDG